jgi:hypothetical protein
MSDLRFARELGAEFERVARASAVKAPRRWLTRPTSAAARIAAVVAIAVPIGIAVLAVALIGPTNHSGPPSSSPRAGQPPFGVSGGSCRTAVKQPPRMPRRRMGRGADHLSSSAHGVVAGKAWQLRTGSGEYPEVIEHGQLILAGHRYPLCSQLSVPVAFGVIDAGAHGIVYGYTTEGANYRFTIAGQGVHMDTRFQDVMFFIAALPRSACSYPSLSVTATEPPVGGLPPGISKDLDAHTPRLTTTLHFGACHPGRSRPVTLSRGQRSGRSPNASLARVIASPPLKPPAGSDSRARGITEQETHHGHNGISIDAFDLDPGRYVVWLLGGHRPSVLARATVRHALQGTYDLPAKLGHGRQIAIARPSRRHPSAVGQIVLQANLR